MSEANLCPSSPVGSYGRTREDDSILIRPPQLTDAAAIRQLVRQSGVLDVNSCYLYLLLCRDFAQTCRVAESVRNSGSGRRIVGFVTAYRPPDRPSVLFVWQIAVHDSARRRGLGLRMLDDLTRHAMLRCGVTHVEATISAANKASRSLFVSLSGIFACELTEHEGFSEGLFAEATDKPSDHDAEPLIRLGPLTLPEFEGSERSPSEFGAAAR